MEVIIFLGWITLSFGVAILGTSRNIGGIISFIVSIIFTPIIGLLVVIASTPIEKENNKAKLFRKDKENLMRLVNKKVDQGKLGEAGGVLQVALELEPNNPNLHFKLATIYSILKFNNESYFHLSKAVEYGYNNFKNIITTPDLSWLRQQPEFDSFVANGYRIVDTKTIKKNYIDELKDLAELRQNNILTEEEFLKKKAEILSSKT